MVKKRKKKKKDTIQNLQYFPSDLSNIKTCQDKITGFCISINLNPIRVTKKSIVKYRDMRKEIYLLSMQYSEVRLIYDRLPRKIWQYNENIFNALYVITAFLIVAFNDFFRFLELGIEFSYRDGEMDLVYVLFALFQIPFYLLTKRFFCGRIEKTMGLLYDLKNIISHPIGVTLKNQT